MNACRQGGAVIGVALLGAVVEGAYGAYLPVSLVGAGVPLDPSERHSGALAQAGSLAVRAQPAGLPLDPDALRSLTAVAFTDALHVAYVVASLAILLVAALALTFMSANQVESKKLQSDSSQPLTPTEIA